MFQEQWLSKQGDLMAKPMNTASPADQTDKHLDEPLPGPHDPGGAHSKGYVAQPGAGRPVQNEDPIPLASDAEVRAHVQKPDQSQAVPAATGESPVDSRVTGADR